MGKLKKRKEKICARDTFQQPTANGRRCERTFQLQISLRARPLTQPPWGSRGKIQIIGSKKVKSLQSDIVLDLSKVLEILASMPELHVLNMSNNHIQRTTGKWNYPGSFQFSFDAQHRRVPTQHDLQLPKADLPWFSADPTAGQGCHQCLERGDWIHPSAQDSRSSCAGRNRGWEEGAGEIDPSGAEGHAGQHPCAHQEQVERCWK